MQNPMICHLRFKEDSIMTPEEYKDLHWDELPFEAELDEPKEDE